MREIKFKFVLECDGDLYYSKVVKNMNEIIEHNYLIDELIEYGGCNQGNIAFNDAFVDRGWIIKHTPQYTGLKDKNGVEIYNGDIVGGTISDGTNGKSSVFWGYNHYEPFSYLGCRSEELEVIGNIYENPELLK